MSSDPTESSLKPEWIVPIESRAARADYYFQNVLEDQREWYSAKARTHKRRHLFFAISVIVIGALISCLQTIGTETWVRYLAAGLGAAVSAFCAIDTLLHPGETWQSYRKASENMKREYRLYVNNADIYTEAASEELAYQLLVERVETVLAEEQQLFWQFHSKNQVPQPVPDHPVT